MTEDCQQPDSPRLGTRLLSGGWLLLLAGALVIAPWPMRTAFARHREQLATYDAQCAHIDEAFHAAAPPGNLVLQFAGMDDSPSGQRLLMLMFYYRGSYTVYPHRLFVADTTTVEPPPEGTPLFPPFNPSADWLKVHDVKAKLVIQHSEDGSIHFVTTPP